MKLLAKIIGLAILGAVAACILAVVFSLPVWLLWNWVVPDISGLKPITFLQAI